MDWEKDEKFGQSHTKRINVIDYIVYTYVTLTLATFYFDLG